MKKLLILFTLVFLSCVEAEDVESIIIDNNSKWVEYYNQGDAKGIASLHTLDAVVIPPKSDFVVGRDNIEEMYKVEIEMGNGTLGLQTTDVIQEGLYAYETGLYDIKILLKEKKLMTMGSILLYGKNKKMGIGFARKIFGIQV